MFPSLLFSKFHLCSKFAADTEIGKVREGGTGIDTQIPAVPNKRPPESVQVVVSHTKSYSCFRFWGFFLLFSLNRERAKGGNASLPGSWPRARPAAAEGSRRGRFAALTSRVPGPGPTVSPAFAWKSCSGSSRAAETSSPCAAAQLQARFSPLLRGFSSPFPKARPRAELHY